jgi:hypothetical protein
MRAHVPGGRRRAAASGAGRTAATLAFGVALGVLLSRALLPRPALAAGHVVVDTDTDGALPPWARRSPGLAQTSSQLRHQLLVWQLSQPPAARFTPEQLGKILWAAHYVTATPARAFFRPSWRDGPPHLIGTASCLLEMAAPQWETLVVGLLHNAFMSVKAPHTYEAIQRSEELGAMFGEATAAMLFRHAHMYANGPHPNVLAALRLGLATGRAAFDGVDLQIARISLCDELEEYSMWEPLWSRNWKNRSRAALEALPELAALLGERRLQERIASAVEELMMMFGAGNMTAWSGRFPEAEAAVDGMIALTAGWEREAGTYLPGLAGYVTNQLGQSSPQQVVDSWARWAAAVDSVRGGVSVKEAIARIAAARLPRTAAATDPS